MPRVTSKGQVTIPVTVRYALGIGPGDDVVFAIADGRGVFRRADGVLGRVASLTLPARDGAHPLERLLTIGDPPFAARVRAARDGDDRVRVPDAVVLEILRFASASGTPIADLVECFRDVVAERGILLDNARAVRTAVDALVTGGDPLDAYASARG